MKKVISYSIAATVSVATCGIAAYFIFANHVSVLQPAKISPQTIVSKHSNQTVLAQNVAYSSIENAAPERHVTATHIGTSVLATNDAPTVITEMAADFVPASADGRTNNSPFEAIQLAGLSSGQNAISNLNGNLAAVAKWYGMSSAQLRELILSDSSVHIDSKGRLLHLDAGVTPSIADDNNIAATETTKASAIAPAVVATVVSPYPFDQTFKLHSKPDSTRVLYLNFVGQGSYPAFDRDKLPGTFSNDERLLIQKILLRVAESFAAFDVDVTTEPPAVPSGKIGSTIIITPQTSTIGGWAYYNSFNKFVPGAAIAFCFPNNLGYVEKYIADCVSHELGHTLGLTHQGQLPSTTYYAGQGSGETGWAPIMGVSYYKNLTQWAKGEYANANNTQDAYATMLRSGLSPRVDDHGNSIPFADALTSKNVNGLNNLTGSGVIETPSDIDMFQFFAGAGPVNLSVFGAAASSQLDLSLQLLDVNGKIIASSSTTVTTLAKIITAILPTQGTYYLRVSGAGRGSPLTTGYTSYGSLGPYSIIGTTNLATGLPSLVVINASATTGKAPLAAVFNSGGSAPTPGSKIITQKWLFGDGTAVVSAANASHIFTKPGSYQTTMTMLDSSGITTVKGVMITIN